MSTAKNRRDRVIDTAPPQYRRRLFRLLGTLLIGCAVGLPFQSPSAETKSKGSADGRLRSELPKLSTNVPAHLYFADRQSLFLKAELRVMRRLEDPVDIARAIVEALIKGPQKGLVQTIPAGTELKAIYLGPDNVSYVDLSAAVKTNHPGGSNSEMLTIYSVVNSLILNVSEIKRVKILIEGNEAPTLAGHINLQPPLKAHMLLIR
jgi:spore germination protein GerM